MKTRTVFPDRHHSHTHTPSPRNGALSRSRFGRLPAKISTHTRAAVQNVCVRARVRCARSVSPRLRVRSFRFVRSRRPPRRVKIGIASGSVYHGLKLRRSVAPLLVTAAVRACVSNDCNWCALRVVAVAASAVAVVVASTPIRQPRIAFD